MNLRKSLDAWDDGMPDPVEERECVRCLERKPDVWDRTGEQSDLCDACVAEMVREYALEREAEGERRKGERRVALFSLPQIVGRTFALRGADRRKSTSDV